MTFDGNEVIQTHRTADPALFIHLFNSISFLKVFIVDEYVDFSRNRYHIIDLLRQKIVVISHSIYEVNGSILISDRSI